MRRFAVIFFSAVFAACASAPQPAPQKKIAAAKISPAKKKLSRGEQRELDLLAFVEKARKDKIEPRRLSKVEAMAQREIAVLRFERGDLDSAITAAEYATREAYFLDEKELADGTRAVEVQIKRAVARLASSQGKHERALELLDKLALRDRLTREDLRQIAGDRLVVLDQRGEAPIQKIDVTAELATLDRIFGVSALLQEPQAVLSVETRQTKESATVVPLGEVERFAASSKVSAPDKHEADPDLPSAADAPLIETGEIDGKAVGQMLALHRRAIEACYDRALRAGVKLSGKLEVDIAVEATGDVSDADVLTRQFSNTDLGRCVASAIKRWKFPPISAAKRMTVPFVLGQAMY
jgi:hypothetical protein